MTLQETINGDLKVAMKARDTVTKTVLRVLLAELSRKGKEVEDSVVIKEVQKLIENNITIGAEAELLENTKIEKYLPQMLDKEELINIASTFIKDNGYVGMKDMKYVMAHFTTNFAGMYDGKELSSVVKVNLMK